MTEQQPAHGNASRRPHLRHHWQEHNRGKDDRWQECRDCGKKRPVPAPELGLTFPTPG